MPKLSPIESITRCDRPTHKGTHEPTPSTSLRTSDNESSRGLAGSRLLKLLAMAGAVGVYSHSWAMDVTQPAATAISANAVSANATLASIAMTSQERIAHEQMGFVLAGAESFAVEPLALGRLAVEPLAPVSIEASAEIDELNGAPAQFTESRSAASRPLAESSNADRLRSDPLQMAQLPTPPSAGQQPPVKLTGEQRVIAQHIARSYRVAEEAVERFVYYAFKVAREFRLDPHLILAIMAIESSFDPDAQSKAGAQGLMQVHTRVHTQLFEPFGGLAAAWDPLANIKVGARILSSYMQQYGDIAGALKAYVGAALHDHDGGYGRKVVSRQIEFDAIARRAGAKTTNASKSPVKTQATTDGPPVSIPAAPRG